MLYEDDDRYLGKEDGPDEPGDESGGSGVQRTIRGPILTKASSLVGYGWRLRYYNGANGF